MTLILRGLRASTKPGAVQKLDGVKVRVVATKGKKKVVSTTVVKMSNPKPKLTVTKATDKVVKFKTSHAGWVSAVYYGKGQNIGGVEQWVEAGSATVKWTQKFKPGKYKVEVTFLPDEDIKSPRLQTAHFTVKAKSKKS